MTTRAGKERVQRQARGATRPEDEKRTGQGEVFLEMKDLIAVAELCVKDDRGCNTEDRQPECRRTRKPADDEEDTRAQFQCNDGGKQLRGDTIGVHVYCRAAVSRELT